jgi:hypothetical protein
MGRACVAAARVAAEGKPVLDNGRPLFQCSGREFPLAPAAWCQGNECPLIHASPPREGAASPRALCRILDHVAVRVRRRAPVDAAHDRRTAALDGGGGIQRRLLAVQLSSRSQYRELLGRVRLANCRAAGSCCCARRPVGTAGRHRSRVRVAPLPISSAAHGNTSSPRAGGIAVQAGLVPVSIGLLGAGAILLARVADHSWIALAVTAGTAAIAYGSRLTPLWMFALGGCSGFIGADLSGRGSKGLQRRDPLC